MARTARSKKADREERGPAGPAAVARALALYLACTLPLAAVLFLYAGDLLDVYHGVVVCYRPLPGSDGQGDRVLRFILERESSGDLEVVLPAAALDDYAVPRCISGIPPIKPAEGLPEVHKDAFTLTVDIGGKQWPSVVPSDLILPLLAVLLGLPLRNWAVTGSPLRMTGRVKPPPIRQAPAGQVAPARSRGSMGPPPSKQRRRRRKKRKR